MRARVNAVQGGLVESSGGVLAAQRDPSWQARDWWHTLVTSSLMLTGALLAAGCGQAPPPQFHLNEVEIKKQDISEPQQFEIVDILEAMFGTPDEPFVPPESGLNVDKLWLAAGPVGYDEQGTERGLFRRHCVHCHGITGDGVGPTALFLNPYPRDYRAGKFKFKSTERPARPTRDDLKRTLTEGIAGTAMPSFRLLPETQVDALVEYVMYLAMRGETETSLIQYTVFEVAEGESIPTTPDVLIDEVFSPVVERWHSADEQIIRPDPRYAPSPDRSAEELAQSIAAGRDLFYGTKANCVKCHGPSAQGDGQTSDFDDWSKAVIDLLKQEHPDLPPNQLAELPVGNLGVLPLRNIHPRNLRLGVYRFGRRPLDLYRRVFAGIDGVPMPGIGATDDALKVKARSAVMARQGDKPSENVDIDAEVEKEFQKLKQQMEQELWQLVDYVQSLPYEPASEPPKAILSLGRQRL